jgi:CelD/BcsL family acetyltransferase involved in cellulose biosynthesis
VEETDYLDLICREEDAAAVWTAVFRRLTAPDSDFPNWHTIELCNVPQDSPSRELAPALAADHGLAFAESVHEVCPVVALPPNFDAYLEMLDSKQRREIRRKLRRADGLGVELVQIGPDDDLETAVDDFLELLQKSTAEKRDWLNAGRRAVFHATAKAAREKGYLQLLFTEVNGEKASALFNFDYRDRVLVYNSGLDPASFGRLSLGEVLTAQAIRLAIENGRRAFDFLRGDEAYKYRFGAEDTMVYKLQIKANDHDRE